MDAIEKKQKTTDIQKKQKTTRGFFYPTFLWNHIRAFAKPHPHMILLHDAKTWLHQSYWEHLRLALVVGVRGNTPTTMYNLLAEYVSKKRRTKVLKRRLYKVEQNVGMPYSHGRRPWVVLKPGVRAKQLMNEPDRLYVVEELDYDEKQHLLNIDQKQQLSRAIRLCRDAIELEKLVFIILKHKLFMGYNGNDDISVIGKFWRSK